MPSSDKITFNSAKWKKKFSSYFNEANEDEIRILERCLKYGKRKSASSLLKLEYFDLKF